MKMIGMLVSCLAFLCHSMERTVSIPALNELQKKYQYWEPLEYPEYLTPAHETVTVFLQALMNKHLYFEPASQEFVITQGGGFSSPTSTKNFLENYTGKITIKLDEAELILRALDICFIEKRPINFFEDKKPIDYSRTILEYSEFSEYYDIKSTKNYKKIKNVRAQLLYSIKNKEPHSLCDLLETNYQLNKAQLWNNEPESPKNKRRPCQPL